MNNYVIRQGMPSAYIYIVKNGSFEILRKTRYKPIEDDKSDEYLKYLGPCPAIRYQL